jgi:Tol biopolymer transport system component
MKKNNLLMLIIFISLIVMIGVGFSSCTSNKKSIMMGGVGGPAAKYKILFLRDMGGGNSDIFVMNADGSGQTNLTPSSTVAFFPVWSPNGSKILFLRYMGGGDNDIWVMNPDGSSQTNLTNSLTKNEIFPVWSPDGSKILFLRDMGGGNRDIWVMNADGSNQTNLTNSPDDENFPSWSPVTFP